MTKIFPLKQLNFTFELRVYYLINLNKSLYICPCEPPKSFSEYRERILQQQIMQDKITEHQSKQKKNLKKFLYEPIMHHAAQQTKI